MHLLNKLETGFYDNLIFGYKLMPEISICYYFIYLKGKKLNKTRGFIDLLYHYDVDKQ